MVRVEAPAAVWARVEVRAAELAQAAVQEQVRVRVEALAAERGLAEERGRAEAPEPGQPQFAGLQEAVNRRYRVSRQVLSWQLRHRLWSGRAGNFRP